MTAGLTKFKPSTKRTSATMADRGSSSVAQNKVEDELGEFVR